MSLLSHASLTERVLLTGDPDDFTKLTAGSGRPKAQRIAVVRV